MTSCVIAAEAFVTKECSEEAGLCYVPHAIVEDFLTVFANCGGHLFLSTSPHVSFMDALAPLH